MADNKPQFPEFGKNISNLLSKVSVLAAILFTLAGLDALFTKMFLKNTSPMVGGILILFGVMQLPAILRMRRKANETSTTQFEGMSFGPGGIGPDGISPERLERVSAPPLDQYAAPAPGAGTAIARYTYKMSNQVFGLFITAAFFMAGMELLFLHKFIATPPEHGLRIFAWASLVLGGLGFLSGLKSMLFPKPAISVTDQGISLSMFGFGGTGTVIPWTAIKGVRLTSGQTAGSKNDSLGLKLDPSFPAHGLVAMALKAGNGELVLPVHNLNAPAQAIVSEIDRLWQTYSIHPSETKPDGFNPAEKQGPKNGF